MEVAELAAAVRSRDLGGVVGLDLAGDESTYNNSEYIACFRYAKEVLNLNTTVHAGESVGTQDDVKSAILEMKVDRVGHGYASTSDPEILEVLAASEVHLEACPHGAARRGFLKAIGTYEAMGLSFGLNEDDPTQYFENCTMAGTEEIVVDGLDFSAAAVATAYLHARAAAFGPT
uniref:adenosine deaminase n=2 Tax=Lotharella globosa TaxID=91324 RepID=A0A6U3EB11_9EUKA|mmetsp:Transcript_6096/g.11462  ORF Transcript_6096/g.11462 Transcript_6096/m.11462 type:complete len:175 (-) Transcript_6096:162-686(-)